MCFGEDSGDTFHPGDMAFLRTAVSRQMPDYRPTTHDNGQIAWMVLEPAAAVDMPRFTICRVDPCIVVQIEEATERRFISVASLDDAIVIARRAVAEAAARCNIHLAPKAAQ